MTAMSALVAGSLVVPASADGSERRPRAIDRPVRPVTTAAETLPGEILVTYHDAPGGRARRAVRAAAPGLVRAKARGPRFDLIEVVPGQEAAAIARLAAQPGVFSAEMNRRFRASGVPPVNDPTFGDQWGLENTKQFGYGKADADIDAPAAWATGTGDLDAIVAVVDTGVDLTHPDLDDHIWTNAADPLGGGDDDGNGLVDDVNGWDWIDGDNDPTDENGHGTHVAGIAAAESDNAEGIAGVAQVSILPLRVLDEMGAGTTDDIAAAFDYAGEMGAHIVNASLGSAGGPEPSGLRAAIAAHPGTLYVVAAGNDGSDVDSIPDWPCSIDEPNLICVASSDEGDARSSFSNYGSGTVHLTAPGSNIWSTMPAGSLASTGGWSVTDSPDGTYANDTSTFLWRQVDLTGRSDCTITIELAIDTAETFDGLYAYVSADETFEYPADNVDGWAGYTGGEFVTLTVGDDSHPDPLGPFEGSMPYIAFEMYADEAIRSDGAYLDDIDVDCAVGGDPLAAQGFEGGDMTGWSTTGDWGPTQGSYFPLYGTSMASPMVAGAAALLWSERDGGPGAPDTDWAQHVAHVIRGGLDPSKPWMESKTVWGGRLNVGTAMAMVGDLDGPVPPSIAATDVGKTWQRGMRFDVRSTTTSDVGPAGVRSYDVQKRATTYRGGFGAWATLFSEQRTGSFKGAPGRTYCFRSRATDNAFNTGDWSARRCTSIPVNDRALDASAAWNEVTPSGSFRGTAMRATARGSTLKLTKVKAKELALVATRCGACGKVAVFRGGKRLAVIDLSGSLERNKVFPVKTFAKVTKPATITIKVLSRGKTVMVEGLGVSRT